MRDAVSKPEILAPAGSIEALDAALCCGADAVYIGGMRFGARAYADNPDEAALLAALDRAHIRGKKVYLTVNTLFKERELEEELVPFLSPYVQCGLDGVIVQDFGALDLLHAVFPELPLHASTQMAVTGPRGAALLAKRGVTRVVPARELSLDELVEIREQSGLEVECFVHGAMCYSVSGMCLMSSLIGGRSGNRGRCAGFCRTAFTRADRKSSPGQGILSMKDLCAIERLPELIRAGVTSLKIEGRMKRPAYSAGLSEIYRKYVDLAFADPDHYAVEEADLRTLRALFNRDGFTDGYFYRQNGREMIAVTDRRDPDEETSRSRAAQAIYDEFDAMRAARTGLRSCEGTLRLRAGAPMELRLAAGDVTVQVGGAAPERADRAPVDDARILTQLNKTGGTLFAFERISIDRADETPLFVPMGALNALRRAAFDALQEAILAPHRGGRILPAPPLADPAYKEEQALCGITGDHTAGAAIQILVSDRAQLLTVLAEPRMRGSEVFLPLAMADAVTIREVNDADFVCSIALPHLVRAAMRDEITDRIAACDVPHTAGHILVRDLEGLGILSDMGLLKYAIADGALYAMNTRASRFLRSFGIASDTAPVELNAAELAARDNGHSALTIYGRTPLMISAQCVAKTTTGCTRRNELVGIRDRKGVEFPVQCVCGDPCHNIIYNSVPTALFSEWDAIRNCRFGALRIAFTTESREETAEVLHALAARGEGAKDVRITADRTRGHFRRGVL